jgi:hypothetical protein
LNKPVKAMSGNQSVIIKRRVRRDFTTLPNDLIRDSRLSWKALGLVVYILSLPDDFRLRLSYLTKQKKDGRDGTRAGLKELELAGYLTIRQERGERGKFTQVIWEVTDEPCGTSSDNNPPCSENPNTVKPNTDKPDSENPTLINTNNKQKLKTKITTTKHIANEQVVVEPDDLNWPCLLSDSKVRTSALQILQECPKCEQQNVLHEIAGLSSRGEVRSPVGLLRKLVQKANQGKFVPSAALEYQRKLESEAKASELRKKERKRHLDSLSPQAKESAKSQITELRKKVNI